MKKVEIRMSNELIVKSASTLIALGAPQHMCVDSVENRTVLVSKEFEPFLKPGEHFENCKFEKCNVCVMTLVLRYVTKGQISALEYLIDEKIIHSYNILK
jgi:hypothetical protein